MVKRSGITKQVQISIPDSLLSKLRERAKEEHRSLSNMVTVLCYEIFDKEVEDEDQTL